MSVLIEFKEGKVIIDGEAFSNPYIIGQLLLAEAKEQNEQQIKISA